MVWFLSVVLPAPAVGKTKPTADGRRWVSKKSVIVSLEIFSTHRTVHADGFTNANGMTLRHGEDWPVGEGCVRNCREKFHAMRDE
jgi:hypothetical protein